MNKRRNMLEGSPIKSIILFALPIMASSMLQYNYSLVDNIIVGRYVSEHALAAVGSVGDDVDDGTQGVVGGSQGEERQGQ